MAKETTVRPRTFLEKLLILWQTKNHSKRTYDIALILAVAIYMNKHIFKEEINSASEILDALLVNGGSEEVMEYIRMKLCDYQNESPTWQKDVASVMNMILEDEELFSYVDDIFHSDNKLDPEERSFIAALKHALNRP